MSEMQGILEYLNQSFKMKIVIYANRRFFEIHKDNYFHFNLLVKNRKTRHPHIQEYLASAKCIKKLHKKRKNSQELRIMFRNFALMRQWCNYCTFRLHHFLFYWRIILQIFYVMTVD